MRNESRPVAAHWRMSMAVMTKPEMTKKTSTPMKPPGMGRRAWKATTSRTASARMPWMSARRREVVAGALDGSAVLRVTVTCDAPR